MMSARLMSAVRVEQMNCLPEGISFYEDPDGRRIFEPLLPDGGRGDRYAFKLVRADGKQFIGAIPFSKLGEKPQDMIRLFQDEVRRGIEELTA